MKREFFLAIEAEADYWRIKVNLLYKRKILMNFYEIVLWDSTNCLDYGISSIFSFYLEPCVFLLRLRAVNEKVKSHVVLIHEIMVKCYSINPHLLQRSLLKHF